MIYLLVAAVVALPGVAWAIALLLAWNSWLKFCREMLNSPRNPPPAIADLPPVAEAFLTPLAQVSTRRRPANPPARPPAGLDAGSSISEAEPP